MNVLNGLINKQLNIAVIIHVYYQAQFEYIAQKLQAILVKNRKQNFCHIDIHITLPKNRENELYTLIQQTFQQATIHTVENYGMDLLPFFSLIPSLQYYDWLLKLHTKNNDTPLNKIWFETVIDGLIGSIELFFGTLEILMAHPNWGMAGLLPFFLSSEKLKLGNQANTEKLAELWDLDISKDWGFFAGSFYWIKPQVLLNPAQLLVEHIEWFQQDFTHDGQMAHAVERLIAKLISQHQRIGLLFPTIDENNSEYKLAFCLDDTHPFAINYAFSHQLLESYQTLLETVTILDEVNLLGVRDYQEKTGIDFSSDKTAYEHFTLVGQFSGLASMVLPIALKQQQEKLFSWEKIKHKPRIRNRVSIIIPVFNEIKLTLLCLESIRKSTAYPDYEIIIVDNGSNFITQRALKVYARIHPKCQIYRLENNLNFSIGCNYGFSKSTGEYVLFLNNDTEVTKGWLQKLVHSLQIPNVVITQPLLCYPDKTVQCAGIEFGTDGFGYERLNGKPITAPEVEISQACSALTGACMLLRASDFSRVQGFDTWYINGQEDIDLCLRIRALNRENILWYEANSLVIHATSQSVGRKNLIDQNRQIYLLNKLQRKSSMKESKLKLANQLFREGKYEEALTLYNEILGIYPLLDSYIKFNIYYTSLKLNKSSLLDTNIHNMPAHILEKITQFPNEIQNTYITLYTSGLFDEEYYNTRYMDIANLDLDPLQHFIEHGAKEFRHPAKGFNTFFYQDQMTQEEKEKYNPLEHYILYGKKRALLTDKEPQRIFPPLASGQLYIDGILNTPGKIAIMLHMYYPDLAPRMISYLNNIPFSYDLLISTDTSEKAKELEQEFSKAKNLGKLIIKVTENRGRDIAPLVVAFGKELLNYDFALHLHSKKSPYGTDIAGWLDFNLENLLHDPLYIAHLLYRLSNENLGALITSHFPNIIEGMHWEYMKDYGLKTLTKLGIPTETLDLFPLEFPAGSMFWFKPKALKPLLDGYIKLEDFEPEAGQMNGTLAHVIERLFLYIIAHQGYTFEFIRPPANYENSIPFVINVDNKNIFSLRNDKAPKVSIVIPVYNQWQYTYNCLCSILLFTDYDVTPYEIILGDDCSTDETINAKKYFNNVIVARTQSNLGFSGNCQNAAKRAKGQYILFLNNDTQVQPRWLDTLLEVFDKRPDALITGSKLMYEDCSLQEAGGIVWQDASGANYGRNDNPFKAEYCYVKQSDYISGAAILVKKTFWDKVGGFDDLFIPAYYEDTDLCMQAREQGGQVYLQPASEVIHFEGKSHGTDVTVGTKAYQVANKEKFYNKWKKELSTTHTTGENILRARERSMDKKVIVVMDLLLPEYDRHAGARHTYDYLKLLVDKGYTVKFLACRVDELRQLNFAGELSQMGIETYYPNIMYEQCDWNQWLIERKSYIDVIIFNRPFIAKPHIETCKAIGLPMLYFCHDIHALREYRVAKNAGKDKIAENAKISEKKEMEVFRAMDFSYTPSIFEKEYLAKEYNIKNVEVLPLFITKDSKNIVEHNHLPKNLEITFVGSMKHKPNEEAVIWFIKEVLPNVKTKQLQINIIGPNPSDKLMKLAEDNKSILVLGGVSDEELDAKYSGSRVIIIPLLSGAGVKGKIIEGFKNGIPIVSTSVGLEGIKGVETILKSHDQPKDFAKEVDRILSLNEMDWLKESKKLQKFYKENYSYEAGWKALAVGLEKVGILK